MHCCCIKNNTRANWLMVSTRISLTSSSSIHCVKLCSTIVCWGQWPVSNYCDRNNAISFINSVWRCIKLDWEICMWKVKPWQCRCGNMISQEMLVSLILRPCLHMQCGKWERASGSVIFSHENEEAAFLRLFNQLHAQHLVFMTVLLAMYMHV